MNLKRCGFVMGIHERLCFSSFSQICHSYKVSFSRPKFPGYLLVYLLHFDFGTRSCTTYIEVRVIIFESHKFPIPNTRLREVALTGSETIPFRFILFHIN